MSDNRTKTRPLAVRLPIVIHDRIDAFIAARNQQQHDTINRSQAVSWLLLWALEHQDHVPGARIAPEAWTHLRSRPQACKRTDGRVVAADGEAPTCPVCARAHRFDLHAEEVRRQRAVARAAAREERARRAAEVSG